MRVKAKDMKSCFTCRCNEGFIIPNACFFDYEDITIECVKRPDVDRDLVIGNDCSDYEPRCNHKIILKES